MYLNGVHYSLLRAHWESSNSFALSFVVVSFFSFFVFRWFACIRTLKHTDNMKRRNDVVLKLKCSLLNPVKNETERIAIIRYIQGFSKGIISTLIESGTILMRIVFLVLFFLCIIPYGKCLYFWTNVIMVSIINRILSLDAYPMYDLSKLEGYHLLCQYET